MHPRRKRPRYLLPPTPSTMPTPLINHHQHPSSSSSSSSILTRPTPSCSSTSATGQTQACAACKFQRRKCAPDCILAPYFPHDRTRQFQNAHKLFGVSNITKIIKNLGPLEKDEAMRTIIYQSDARAYDPVGGCFSIIRDLQRQIDLCQAELDLVLRQLEFFRQQEAAAALGCDLMSSPVTAVPSADPFVQAFAVLPSDELHQNTNNNIVNNNNNNIGFVKEFNVNLNNSCDAVAWAMQDYATRTSNDNDGVDAMPHHQQHRHLIHEHVGDGGGVDHDDNNCSSKQTGFNISDHCDDIKPLILDLPPDDSTDRRRHLGFPSEDAIDKW